MSTAAARTGGPSAGLPDGVFLAPMGRRVVAYLIDVGMPYVFVLGGSLNLATGGPGWLSVILYLLPIVWGLLVWAQYALAAAGPGMRVMGLQLVGLSDGRPLGWRRALLRGVLLTLISGTGVILIIMVVMLLSQQRRQGWPDLVVDSVVIEERPVAPPREGESRSIGEWLRNLTGGRKKSSPPAATEAGPSDETPESKPVETQQQPTPEPAAEPAPQPAADGARTVLVEEPEPTAEPAAADPKPAESKGAESAPEPAPAEAAAPTTAAPTTAAEGWYAVLDGDREIAITGLVLFGRNPQARPGEEPQVIKVVDAERTVSKTHLALALDAQGVLVSDRGSTNGSAVTDPDGSYELLTADTPVRIPGEGYVVSFGKHHLRIVRRMDGS